MRGTLVKRRLKNYIQISRTRLYGKVPLRGKRLFLTEKFLMSAKPPEKGAFDDYSQGKAARPERYTSGPLAENKKGIIGLEFVVAERKSFLSRKKLVYRCALSLDDTAKTVRFYEILKESGYGLSGEGLFLRGSQAEEKQNHRA